MEQIKIYHAKNEPVLSYMKGSKERLNVEEAYNRMFNSRVEIPLYIGSERIITNERKNILDFVIIFEGDPRLVLITSVKCWLSIIIIWLKFSSLLRSLTCHK